MPLLQCLQRPNQVQIMRLPLLCDYQFQQQSRETDKNYYPMGNKRSLNDFWKTIKFDYTKHTLEDQAPIDKQKTRCANLKKIKYHTF